ncbi:MAG: hypothetical protein ACRDOL_37720 [Streptosporangiaceae bacterium]
MHASTLVLLAGEQRAGRLRISPRAITAVSEPLTEDDRIAIGDAFAVPPVSQFTSTEGPSPASPTAARPAGSYPMNTAPISAPGGTQGSRPGTAGQRWDFRHLELRTQRR